MLYPTIEPFKTHRLKVSNLHELYLEESGNKNGRPVIFVHGGPGSGTKPDHRQYFDPKKYRIILFDQRGCGQSTPNGEIKENTTKELIEDIEAIRRYLNIEKVVLFGGSWGSTLSLVYAQKYPQNVEGMILRSVFLGDQEALDWTFKFGAGEVFPEYWEKFKNYIPESEQTDLLQAYNQRIFSGEEEESKEALVNFGIWEAQTASLVPNEKKINEFRNSRQFLTSAKMEAYYFINKCFLEEDQIIKNMDKIANLPGIIIHGRYDVLCPLSGAYKLHKRWPNSKLHIVPLVGHREEGEMTDLLVEAADSFA